MAAIDGPRGESRAGALLNDPRIRGIVYQVVFLVAIVWIGWDIVDNTITNLRRANIASGYGFLDRTAGFGIIQSLIGYSETSSYGRALVVGFLNTLLIAVLGVFFATLIGFVVGIGRLSSNWLVSRLAAVYVEVFRNIPLLLQLFFWYFAVLRHVPGMREKWTLFGGLYINIGGLYVPRPVFGETAILFVASILFAIAVMIVIANWAKARQERTGRRPPVVWINLAVLAIVPTIAFFALGKPIAFDWPVFNETGPLLQRGFQKGTGLVVIPEFVGLLLALSIYTASFIAEIVRAGITAVSHGQTEAAYSLGLRPGATLRLVILPQALRVIIPPLTNQYLNLIKNSSLAVAVAYPDFVSVGGTVLNQTGQAVEIVLVWMAVYLGISLLTSLLMNIWNSRMALVER